MENVPQEKMAWLVLLSLISFMVVFIHTQCLSLHPEVQHPEVPNILPTRDSKDKAGGVDTHTGPGGERNLNSLGSHFLNSCLWVQKCLLVIKENIGRGN